MLHASARSTAQRLRSRSLTRASASLMCRNSQAKLVQAWTSRRISVRSTRGSRAVKSWRRAIKLAGSSSLSSGVSVRTSRRPSSRDRHGGVAREIARGPPVGFVELLAEARQFRGRRGRASQGPADARPHLVPGWPLQEFGVRVAPASAGGHEQVTTSEAVLEPFQGAKRVQPAIDLTLRSDDDPLPGRRQESPGSLTHVGPLLPLDGLEEAECLDRGTARVGRRELNRLQEHGQEATHVTVAGPQILEIVIVGYPNQLGDLGDGLGELVPGNAGENGVADAPVSTAEVEQDKARLVEEQRGAHPDP